MIIERDVETQNPFFSKFNEQPRVYAFHNQIHFLLKSVEEHRYIHPKINSTVFIQDFTPFEHVDVYAQAQFQSGNLDAGEFDVLTRLAKVIDDQFIVPKMLIYREISFDEICNRMKKRGRRSELKLLSSEEGLAYLKVLVNTFDLWIHDWTRSPIIRIPAEFDVFSEGERIRNIATQIETLLQSSAMG
ncbi:MAG: deoxynucleoside kinase [Chloroflexi bacterium]|nr:deoxynucleoside kinase [Chloroflexota bacterium]